MKTKDIIIKSLDITELEYCEMVMQNGFCWLNKHFGAFQLMDKIATLPLFWKWWNNQWEIRDREFIYLTNVALIDEILTGKTRNYARSIYNEMHNPYGLKILMNVWVRNDIDSLVLNETVKEEESIKMMK